MTEAIARGLAAAAPTMPRPYRAGGETAARLNDTCVSCHEAEAAEWQGSLHHKAYDNAPFQAALAIEPSPFCRGCHAPEADFREIPAPNVGALGVGCVTCHAIDDGVVLSGTATPAGGVSTAPHRVRRSAEFGQTGGCASCHEFRFPAAPSDDDGRLMQMTVREHARSPAADKGCGTCHMPAPKGAPGRRSHAFAEVRDPGWLKERLQVTAALVDRNRARLTLVQTMPGHGFPTGDLFRRLEVGAELRAPDGKVLKREVRHLTRHFAIVPGQSGRTMTDDDRVFDTPRVVELPLVPPGTTPTMPRHGSIAWWVTYQRVGEIGKGADPNGAVVESEVKLHAGVLPWETK